MKQISRFSAMEALWFIIALFCATFAVNLYIRGDHNNGVIFVVCTVIALLMFLIRRKMRKNPR